MGALLIYIAVNITHVVGHLGAARFFEIRVDRLSLGVGPTVWQTFWRGTAFRLAALPVGLLVRLDPHWNKGEPPPVVEAHDFCGASAVARLVVISAPLLLLLLLGWVSAFHLHGVGVYGSGRVRVGRLQEGGPADTAGLRVGDVIIRVGAARIGGWNDLVRRVQASEGRALVLALRRDGADLERIITPRKVEGRWFIGLHVGLEELVRVEEGWARARASVSTVGATLGRIGGDILSLVVGPGSRAPGGPVEIITRHQPAGAASRRARWVLDSVLGYFFICLLPLPFLDGRRLGFWLIALIARRRLHPRWEQGFNRWGFVAVGLTLLAVVASDLMRLVR